MNATDTVGLTEFLVIVYSFFKRNFKVIILAILIGIGTGLLYATLKPKYYYSEMIGFSSVLDKTSLLEILSPLTHLVEDKNYQRISQLLSISIADARQIRSIEFSDSRHTKTSNSPAKSDLDLGKLIMVKINVYDLTKLSEIQNGLIHFIEQNNYVKTSTELQKKKTKSVIANAEKNIAKFDSLIYSSKSSSTITVNPNINPVNYNESIDYLETQKIKMELLQPFVVVSNFYHPIKPANKTTVIVSAITLAFFGLGLMLVFLTELARLANQKE